MPPETLEDLESGKTDLAPELYNNLNGLYLYDGQFMGVFSRLGPRPTISKDQAGITSATIWVDCGEIFEEPVYDQGCDCDGCC